MPVRVVTTFIKADASTEDYSNPEVKKVYEEYVNSNKIIDVQSSRSEDGLVQKRTRIFADKESYDAFRIKMHQLKNSEIRKKWCEENNVSVDTSVVEE